MVDLSIVMGLHLPEGKPMGMSENTERISECLSSMGKSGKMDDNYHDVFFPDFFRRQMET